MLSLARGVLVVVFCLRAASAFAAGGSCHAIPVPSGVTNCFYIAASGADTNPGTSESSPWQHAPGMSTCSETCSRMVPKPGMGFIFRGGDTWHMGDSSASPFTGGTFDWHTAKASCSPSPCFGGASGNPVYIGVDGSWYNASNCSSWCRPVFNGDNPISTSVVSKCAYQVGPSNILVNFNDVTWVVLDNFELLGLCQNAGSNSTSDTYLSESVADHNVYEHLYFHGWTHSKFIGGSFRMRIVSGNQTCCGNTGVDRHLQIVIDGSDSDPGGAIMFFGGGYNIYQSVFRYVVGMLSTTLHSYHDNLMEYLAQPADYAAHGNVFESSGENRGDNVFYNNVIRQVCTVSQCKGLVNIWLQPGVGNTDYVFNNVEYSAEKVGNYFNIGQNANSGNQGKINIFNNTWENTGNGAILTCAVSGYAEPFAAANNLYITDASSAYGSSACAENGTFATELLMSHGKAAREGYTQSEIYGYSPSSASSRTVRAGTNEGMKNAAFCDSLSSSNDPLLQEAGTACRFDTTYSCLYNGTIHTINCPARTPNARPADGAWDIGAYQFPSSSASSVPAAGVLATRGPKLDVKKW
jgi:hypothetical protein